MDALRNTFLIIVGGEAILATVLYLTVRRHRKSIRNGLEWVFRRRYQRRAEVDAAMRRHPAGRAR